MTDNDGPIILKGRFVRMMDVAIKMAKTSEAPNRHGCVIAVKNKIMARGVNKSKTHPIAIKSYSQMIHAEVACIVALNEKDLRGADMFVCRVMRNTNLLGMSKPCKHCQELIRMSGIKRVFYTNREGKVLCDEV